MSGGWPAGASAPTRTIAISEIFGPTVQGEGPATGERAIFVRTANCNLACSWCDTPYSWDWSRFDKDDERHPLTIEATAAAVRRLAGERPYRLVLTGGEPALQQEALVDLLADLNGPRNAPHAVDIETNGTIDLERDLAERLAHIVVSPKLANAGMPARRRLRMDVLANLCDWGAHLKIVVGSRTDLHDAEALRVRLDWPLDRCWAMPLGATEDQTLVTMRALAGPILANGWNVSPRLHAIIWGNRRGT